MNWEGAPDYGSGDGGGRWFENQSQVLKGTGEPAGTQKVSLGPSNLRAHWYHGNRYGQWGHSSCQVLWKTGLLLRKRVQREKNEESFSEIP